jgi:uncharacterized phage protein (TIGR01671 family)
MREIKFRAWDGEKMRFTFTVAGFEFADPLCIMTSEEFARKTYGLKEWKVMQYTGLKDMTGRELYDGDYVAFEKVDDVAFKTKEIHEGLIVWLPKGARFAIRENKWKTRNLAQINLTYLGNIYENPELLEE